MGRHEEDPIPPNPNLYPEELQLKLYQAFIFSIPILFSIILFLLFYLFYLKRRANNNMSVHPPRLQQSAHHSVSFLSPPWSLGIKGEIKDKLQAVEFDEELKARDSLCCVCLGEFELKEELRQLPMCKHIFHGDCIRHWLRTNATCPLCRCAVLPALKMDRPSGLEPDITSHENDNIAPQAQHEQENVERSTSSLDMDNSSRSEEHVIQIVDEPSSSSNNT